MCASQSVSVRSLSVIVGSHVAVCDGFEMGVNPAQLRLLELFVESDVR